MNAHQSRIAFLLIAVGSAICASMSFAAAPLIKQSKYDEAAQASEMDPEALAKIAPRMEQFVKDKQIAGAVTLVMRQGKLVHFAAVGLADVAHERPMGRDAIFEIASMTKPITATAIMILQDEGKLSVTDPVSKYIPKFKDVQLGEHAPAREITIRDLMTHTSGIGPLKVKKHGEDISLRETAEQIAAEPLQFEPGSKWRYGDGITVCGGIIEIVSGKPYAEFLKERVFTPLGMNDTTFNPDAAQRARIATMYHRTERGNLEAMNTPFLSEDPSHPKTPYPSGGLFSTASDLARFYQMVLNAGELDGKRVVSHDAVEQMTHVQTGDLVTGFTPGNGWGLGWCIVREPQGITKMLSPGTFGHGGAFGTQGWIDPKRKMILILLVQRNNFPNSDASEVREAFQQLAAAAVRQE
jgi:CubicO group peptidase (beta-lactamase class C family)